MSQYTGNLTHNSSEVHSLSVVSKLLGIRPTVIELALSIPEDARSIVIFAHGGGSGVSSPRNQQIANSLSKAGFATLLVDLLGHEEKEFDKRNFEYRFNIPLLSERLTATMQWVWENPATSNMSVGLFGASTGSAAALTVAATASRAEVKAIVSRGGRPDLVKQEHMTMIETPTIFIVGENDKSVINWTRNTFKCLEKMKEKRIVVIPGAGHLFEEPGTLEKVAELSIHWFKKFLLLPR
jgi:dienelactone hydrolase